ncbi:Non-catalytic module family DOC2, partial [Piromyces sp. E2]
SCWSENLGYKCCDGCDIIYEDNDGKWGVENDNWCGISNACKSLDVDVDVDNNCFSIILGYPCCNDCNSFYYEDNDGKWGVENNSWCGIKSTC